MRLDTVKMLGISITINGRKEILEHIEKYLREPSAFSRQLSARKIKPLIIVTPNPEQVVFAQTDSRFAKILNNADIAIPDGIGILLANRLLGISSKSYPHNPPLERITGISLLNDIAGMCSEQAFRVGLIGGKGNLAVEALECLKAKYPGLDGWSSDCPDFIIRDSSLIIPGEKLEPYLKRLLTVLKKEHINVLFVGLGAPKQEYFIEAVSCQLSAVSRPLVLMAVGGSFDEISGRTPATPNIIDRLGFKWLWRLLIEPWRWRRQLALLGFIYEILKEKIHLR